MVQHNQTSSSDVKGARNTEEYWNMRLLEAIHRAFAAIDKETDTIIEGSVGHGKTMTLEDIEREYKK